MLLHYRGAPLLAAALLASSAAMSSIDLPGASGGVGFDDLQFSRDLHRVIAPAGRTGRLDLVDPVTGEVTAIDGFSSARTAVRGHGQGTTSADAGQGHVFASDRTERELVAADPGARRIVGRIKLGASPDYVRWVAATHEVWVTEPGREAIEVFSFEAGPPPTLRSVGTIPVPGGPESLVIDPARARAYTNDFGGATFAIDVRSRSVVARWNNHCRGARGIALDPVREIALVGCDEGKAVAVEVANGSFLGEARTGEGVDSIAYSPQLGHLYVPAADSANLTVIGVKGRGELQRLGTMPAARGAHCAAVDDGGQVFVCDPGKGRLLTFHDPYPGSS